MRTLSAWAVVFPAGTRPIDDSSRLWIKEQFIKTFSGHETGDDLWAHWEAMGYKLRPVYAAIPDNEAKFFEETSAKVSSSAAKILGMTFEEFCTVLTYSYDGGYTEDSEIGQLFKEIKSVAGAALAQDETKGQETK